MPRAAPSDVVVHRLELGTWERDHLAKATATDDVNDALKLGLDVLNAVALPVSLVAVGYSVYLGMTHFQSLLNPLKDRAEELKAKAEAAAAQVEADVAAGKPVPTGAPPTSPRSPDVGRGWTWASMLTGGFGSGGVL